VSTRAHALSVDVEDWFQVLNMQRVIDRASWDTFALRCGNATERLLELFAKHGARATFFFLGWIAERLPELVAAVKAAGHEIGSHGYDHRLLHDLGPEGFGQDLARTESILLGITGQTPTSFRACTWTVTRRTLWALPILVERGYRLDSSIFPIAHPDYGIRGAPAVPYRMRVDGKQIVEVPPLVWRVLGRQLAVGGGGWLRLFPLWFLEKGLAQAEANGVPGCVYLHPWEIDPEQPRPGLRGLRAFRHYVNLGKTFGKLDALLGRHRFVGLAEAVSGLDLAEHSLEALR
jgi:polysaccharide deacetylase family protein (PEP-CTERM system associated)